MPTRGFRFQLFLILIIVSTTIAPLWGQEKPSTAPVKMTVTVSVPADKRMPEITRADVIVKQGNARLPVTEWVPARGDRAGLELFILIDDACESSLGSQLDDLRSFISTQPSTTSVGVGYMRNATVQMVQNFTTDHAQAAKAIRLPVGSVGAYGSPYLSLIDLMKRWPEHPNRREVIMVSDGIDRARRGRNALLNPDVDTANNVAERTGTIIHTIYFPGIGHWRRNFWEANNGANGLAKLSDVTGGESFFLGLQSPVSFKPYLDALQKILGNQYLLGFSANPGSKAGLQYVTVSTEIAGVDFAYADAVWVPVAK
ncbi:MAG TPA: hypothetical protein VMF91_18215 [Bryobacteraceae bacterium]|nr:hypothetical protein [Bryobacteraceae bacterium]